MPAGRDAGQGTWNGIAYEAVQTPAAVTHEWYAISFAGSYSAPRFVASMATYSGGNNCELRYRNLTGSGVEVKVEEDTTWDTETNHNNGEAAAYLTVEGDGLLTAVSGPRGDRETSYYYFGGQRVAMRRDGVLYFIVGDHLGTTSAIFDVGGSLQSQSRHYPYGTERWADGTVPTDHRFTGQRFDSYIKLTVMGARWFDSRLGSWISADTLVPDPASPQAFNRFAYTKCSPLRYIDPTGHREEGECGFDGEACEGSPPDLRESLLFLLADPMFVDAVLWYFVPSAVGISGDAGWFAGCGAEGEAYVTSAYVFNWRSGELSQLTGVDLGAYVGTPRVVGASTGWGPMFVWGASENQKLEGIDIYYGATGGADFLGFVGFGVTECKSLAFEDTNGNGLPELQDANGNEWPDLYVDPVSGMQITTLQVSVDAGANGFPNAVDIGGVGGASITTANNLFTIPGWRDWGPWPWNQ